MPRLLDLFCCAGIGADGYARAGWDVVGVDTDPAALRHNPHPTVLADALAVLAGRVPGLDLDTFDAVHASPPCQSYSITRHSHHATHPDLLGVVWQALDLLGLPYVIENVPGAPMPGALTLCGSEFALRAADRDGRTLTLRRHRLFVSDRLLWGAGGCSCAADRAAGRIAGVYGAGSSDRNHAREVRRGGYTPHPSVRAVLLGVAPGRAPSRYLSQAIPPAYTEHLGRQLLPAVTAA